MRCAQCQHDNPTGAKFCLECGTRFARSCTGCGTELPAVPSAIITKLGC